MQPVEAYKVFYEFTIEIADMDEHDYDSLLYECGADDGLVFKSSGRLYVDFCRDAPSYDAAIGSAVKTILEAGGKIIGIKYLTNMPDELVDEPDDDVVARYLANAEEYVGSVVRAGRMMLDRMRGK